MTTGARHETRALLRAHLSAATRYRHLTRHCPVCHRLLRLAMEPRNARPGAAAPAGPAASSPAVRGRPAAEDHRPPAGDL
ncbi:DUF6274 family protein [Streptomyces natalensis]|uniref:DUF6274 family protein n=1 Tax=Streptomyces natalensis TaxID=68242 RepID=UPI00099DE81E|nr:DUF6274 family protein [Streptomyces natalensis]